MKTNNYKVNRVPSIHSGLKTTRHQRGAVLFIALMLLIILTLLGMSAAQVVSLQERMASNYRADAVAFQRAEGVLAKVERDMTLVSAASNVLCENLYQGGRVPGGWTSGSPTSSYHVENLARGASFISTIGALDAGMPSEMADKNCLMLQVSAHAYDTTDPATSSSHRIVQSLYTP